MLIISATHAIILLPPHATISSLLQQLSMMHFRDRIFQATSIFKVIAFNEYTENNNSLGRPDRVLTFYHTF